MSPVKRIDHIAIVVEDLDQALGFWRDALGLDLSRVEEVGDQESTVAFLPTGPSQIELVKPTSQDSGIARYLKKRGPGLHHICLEVDDIQASLDKLKERSVRLINEQPMTGSDGTKYAFIHPESASGVLVELYQLPTDESGGK